MAAVNFELKKYQRAALDTFRDYLAGCVAVGASVAYAAATNKTFVEAPEIKSGTPYVCLRIPTGGGKTVIAAHTVGVAARELLQSQTPMVLWLVPTNAILNQTIAALKNLEHPFRAALARDFGRNVAILSKTEALDMSRAEAEGNACIIVSTIQSFRWEKDDGKEDREGRKVYEDAGALMEHFVDLSAEQRDRLDKAVGLERPIYSLANLLKLHRPMVIVDEAHNARTPLSFDTLARFDPSLILELTATPQTANDPGQDLHPSNILYSVSAAELKAEHMIKMPVKLTTDNDWRNTVGAALDSQVALEEAAQAEMAQTGEYLRPIVLFQAQSVKGEDQDRVTWGKLEKFLHDDKRIPQDQIAVHTGKRQDLDTIPDILCPSCPVRYVITVQNLKEGWDCPFAYVLCSVAEQVSPTAVEQLLGRVLRMPGARLKNRPALNEAYAFVASDGFDKTATQLRDGLVECAGFDRVEVEGLVVSQRGFGIAATEIVHESEPLDDAGMDGKEIASALRRLPARIKYRLAFDESKRTLTHKGAMTREARNRIQLVLAKALGSAETVDRLYAKSNNLQTTAALGADEKPPFIVPRLGFRKDGQGVLELFTTEHFLNLPWPLDQCEARAIVDQFSIVDKAKKGEIDVTEMGQVKIRFIKRLQGDLAAVVHEPAWSLPRLVNWLDAGIDHPDVTRPSARVFLTNALEALLASGFSLDELARRKYDLHRKLRVLIDELRRERDDGKYNALFATKADQFETSADLAMIFDEQTYAYNWSYSGPTKFNKHYTEIIGDLKSSGEEFDCAVHIDRMEEVRYWIRNVDRKENSFWLQLPSGKFYPDFVAMLHDGRILVVEYKGKHLYGLEIQKVKRHIGKTWQEASDGKCLFCMPTDNDLTSIQKAISE